MAIELLLSPLAPACQGHQGCVSWMPAFCLQTPKRVLFTTTTRLALDPLHYQKSIKGQVCFQGSNNWKNCSQGLQRMTKINPELHKTRFL